MPNSFLRAPRGRRQHPEHKSRPDSTSGFPSDPAMQIKRGTDTEAEVESHLQG